MHVPTIEDEGREGSGRAAQTDRIEGRADFDVEGPALTIQLSSGDTVHIGPEAVQIWLALIQTFALVYFAYKGADMG